jgi:hypothetical protein
MGLKGDLLRGMIEALIGKPHTMLLLPHCVGIAVTLTKEKTLDVYRPGLSARDAGDGL